MEYKGEGNLSWLGTKTDLLEIAHLAYLYGDIHDERGSRATFKWIYQRCFALFGLRLPSNPASYVIKATLRKGVKQSSFMERYTYLLFERNETSLFDKLVKRIEA